MLLICRFVNILLAAVLFCHEVVGTPINSSAVLPTCGSGLKYIFSFGDSYTETGFDIAKTKPTLSNPIGNPEYPGTTTSNGPNWIDELVAVICPDNLLLYNFAAGGATVNASNPVVEWVPPFKNQVATFSLNLVPQPAYAADWSSYNSIFTVWFGVNDVNDAYYSGTNITKIATFSQQYYPPLEELYRGGARNFVLINSPPISRTPFWERSSSVGTKRLLDHLGFAWNDELQNIARNFTSVYNDTNMAIVNITNTFNDILDNPTKYGAPDAACKAEDNSSCLWADLFHPARQIQTAVANQVNSILKKNAVIKSMASTSQRHPSFWQVLGLVAAMAFLVAFAHLA